MVSQAGKRTCFEAEQLVLLVRTLIVGFVPLLRQHTLLKANELRRRQFPTFCTQPFRFLLSKQQQISHVNHGCNQRDAWISLLNDEFRSAGITIIIQTMDYGQKKICENF
jgi:hypothetical protein